MQEVCGLWFLITLDTAPQGCDAKAPGRCHRVDVGHPSQA